MGLIYITGGVRSGKSAFAEKLAIQKGGNSVAYIATGVNTDPEMDRRIRLHQERRPASWGLIEAPYQLGHLTALRPTYEVFLLDCLSSWISNRLLSAPEERWGDQSYAKELLDDLQDWLEESGKGACTVLVVSSEVGLGGVAMSRLGRWYADVLGEANQLVARQANEVYAVISGIPWRLKG